jgi:hypothetical protein
MKYLLLRNVTLEFEGRVLFRVFRLADRKIGGWVESTNNLSQRGFCFVYDHAKVFGNACLSGNARAADDCVICDDALVSGSARVSGNARIHGKARVSGDGRVSDQAIVCDQARISGSVRIGGSVVVCGRARLDQSEHYDRFEVIGREATGSPATTRPVHAEQPDSLRPSGVQSGLYRQLPPEEFAHPWSVPVAPPVVAPVPRSPAEPSRGPEEASCQVSARMKEARDDWRVVTIAAAVGALFFLLLSASIRYSYGG